MAAVRKTGIAGLSAEQAARMPPKVDTDNADHLALFKAQIGGGDALHDGITDEAWKGMQAAQATWDAAMAWNAVKALKAATDPNSIMVVLVGSGHVAYGLGIERQARAWFDGAVTSVIGVPVADDDGPAGPVRASYANFVWGVAREPASAWPSLGLSTRAGDGGRRPVIDVEQDSPAARAGLKVGDLIVTIDEVAIDSREALGRQMATYNWGDAPRVTIARGTERLTCLFPCAGQWRRSNPTNPINLTTQSTCSVHTPTDGLGASRFVAFTRDEWSPLRDERSMTLTEADLFAMKGVNEQMTLSEVEQSTCRSRAC